MALEAALLRSKNIKSYAACGYFRLSREDGDKAESDSIKNQKIMVRDFASIIRRHLTYSRFIF